MIDADKLDCILIGYNETPFEEYERLIGGFGEDAEAYRDLKFSFVEAERKKMSYVGLLNYAYSRSHPNECQGRADEVFKSGEIPNLAAVYLTNYLRRRNITARYVNLFQYEKEELAH